MKQITLILLMLAAALGAPAQVLVTSLEADSAFAAIDRQEWDRADSLLVLAISARPADPANVLLLSNLGMIRHYRGLDSLALATLDDAARISPRSTVIMANRANVLTSLGRTDEALEVYDMILDLDPSQARPRYQRALLMLRKGMVDKARADAAALDTIAPDSQERHTLRAAMLSADGDFEEAIPHYSEVIKVNPQPEFYSARAMCYLMTDRLPEAAEDISQGLALDPTDPELYIYRAALNKLRYRPDDAEADARQAIAFGLDPRRAAPFLSTDRKNSSRHK
ncbi:MAG: tetratricopeptide repeat protein [Duncaniella sp.]|nr:tetratricopeptide repeat protein [Duncaniella sp.]